MIIVRLMGGLGNQMFQYAAGKHLAMARGVKMKLDIGFYERDDSRSYALDAFSISEEIASRSEIRHLRYGGKPWWRLQSRKARQAAKDLSPTHIMEKQDYFNKNVLSTGDDAYLDGYWQSERYFYDISEQLRDAFTLKKVSENALEMVKRINSLQSVSVHVRRGDYTSDKKASKVPGTLPAEYYYRALEYLESRLDKFELFLFSDDLNWTRDNLFLDKKRTFVEGFSDVEDMWLMSQCDHNIIANSSFSWWGGWLNINKAKSVIAPVDWFRDQGRDTRNLIPSTWVRL